MRSLNFPPNAMPVHEFHALAVSPSRIHHECVKGRQMVLFPFFIRD